MSRWEKNLYLQMRLKNKIKIRYYSVLIKLPVQCKLRYTFHRNDVKLYQIDICESCRHQSKSIKAFKTKNASQDSFL